MVFRSEFTICGTTCKFKNGKLVATLFTRDYAKTVDIFPFSLAISRYKKIG